MMPNRPTSQGPWLARRLAALLLSERDAHRLLDALDAEYLAHQRRDRGTWRARAWYLRQVVRSIVPMRRSTVEPVVAPAARAGAGWTAALAEAWRDVRYGARSLMKSPVYFVSAALTLAVGIGTSTIVFSVVEAVVLRPLPYTAPDQLVRLWAHAERLDIRDFSFRVLEYAALDDQPDAFEAIGGEFPMAASLVSPGREPRQVRGRMVTSGFFRVFGVEPALGRMFEADEISGGAALVVVVSHGLWIREFGADPGVIGRPVELAGRSYTVIGVLPASYRHPSGSDAEVFIPYTVGTSNWTARWLDLYARLGSEVSPMQAASQATAVMAEVARADGRASDWHATAEPLSEMVAGEARPIVTATFAMVGVLLLIASLNVASLTLARGTGRRADAALRVALGASRARIAWQAIAEGAVVAAVGGTGGILMAVAGVQVVGSALPAAIPRLNDLSVNASLLAFATGVTLATLMVFGVAPALRAARRAAGRAGVMTGNRTTAPEFRSGGLLGGIVVGEVALSLALLVAAGLMVQTFRSASGEPFGFNRGQAVAFNLSVPASRWAGAAGTLAFYRDLRDRLARLPGVVAVGVGSNLPLDGQGAVASVSTEAMVQRGDGDPVTVLQRRAGQGFFAALGVTPLAGREFDDTDTADGPKVAVISESLARRLFPDGAVGKRVGFGARPEADAWMTIVGVVPDIRYASAERADAPQVYQAHTQSATREMSVVVRTEAALASIVQLARAIVADLDPRIPAYDVRTLDELAHGAVADRRFTMDAFALFAIVALLLTITGLSGLLAFNIGCRQREFGVRLALGARREQVVAQIAREGMTLVVMGLVTGALMAAAVVQLLRGLLFGVGPLDGWAWTIAIATIAATGAVASYLPARAAARVDPAHILRRP